MRRAVEILVGAGEMTVVYHVPLDRDVVDLMFDAWRAAHSEELRMHCERTRKAKAVKATYTGGGGI